VSGASSGAGVEVVDSLERREALEGPWDDLVSRVPEATFFATWIFVAACCRWLHREARLRIMVLWAGDRMVGVAPLQEARTPIRLLRFVGHGSADYCDVVVEPSYRAQLAAELAAFLRATSFVLGNVPEDSPNRLLLEGLDGVHQIAGEPNPYIDVEGTFEEYARGAPKRLVQDSRRQERRLRELGSLTHAAVGAAADIPGILDALVRFKSGRNYRHDVAVNVYESAAQRSFLEQLCRESLRRGILRCEVLRLDGDIIAVHVAFLYGGRFYYYLPSFSAQHSRYSPGRLLLQRAIERCFLDRVGEFDFLNGEEAYKADWATGVRATRTYHRLRPGLLSWAYDWWYGRAKPRLRAHSGLFLLVRRVRAGWRRR
jgi:CelD/BcsL family acetyltransferase involved in cellulose biosynthesis